jgi:hypothetical protein
MAGIRDSKTVDGVTYHYDTLNGKVVRQTWTEGTTEHVFDIIYDASGLPYACVYNGSRYYYVLNQQGDVIRIVGYLGATLCEYQYDAWATSSPSPAPTRTPSARSIPFAIVATTTTLKPGSTTCRADITTPAPGDSSMQIPLQVRDRVFWVIICLPIA